MNDEELYRYFKWTGRKVDSFPLMYFDRETKIRHIINVFGHDATLRCEETRLNEIVAQFEWTEISQAEFESEKKKYGKG